MAEIETVRRNGAPCSCCNDNSLISRAKQKREWKVEAMIDAIQNDEDA